MSDMTKEAQEGYRAVAANVSGSPHLWSSNCDAAWRIGHWMAISGRNMPYDCRPSRGDTFHINGMKVKLDWSKTRDSGVGIERIA